jgi:hypothetical protein
MWKNVISDLQAAPRIIQAPSIPVQENIQAGANLADEVSSRRWFLARGLEDNILYIQGVCAQAKVIQYNTWAWR